MGERHWTPYHIEIILHHHCSGARFPRADAPAYGDTLQDLAQLGLIDWVEGIPRTTPLGNALVEMWCSQPIPVAVYVDPRISPKDTA